MEVDTDSSSSSGDSNDEEYEKFKQENLQKKVDVLENRVSMINDHLICNRFSILEDIFPVTNKSV